MEFLNSLFKIVSSKKITGTLLNIMVLLLITLLFMATDSLWIGILIMLWKVAQPFVFGFAVAFVLNPLIDLVDKKFNKRSLSIGIVYVVAFLAIVALLALAIPMLYQSITELFPAFNSGLREIVNFVRDRFNFDISSLTSQIQAYATQLFDTSMLVDTTFDVLNQGLAIVTNFLIYIVLAIYMSSNFGAIRQGIKKVIGRIDRALPKYFKEMEISLRDYVKAFFIGAIAQGITTAIMYIVIGHPNWFILGLVSGISSIIPYVGPIAANCLGLVTSLNMGATTIVILLILIFIQSIVTSYVITPKIYSSRINLSIMWVLFGILSGSTLFGIWGMLLSIPIIVCIRAILTVQKHKQPSTI